MKRLQDLHSLLEEILNSTATPELSARLISNTVVSSPSDSLLWIEQFGDPLDSLSGAKSFAEQLGLDWREAVSAGVAALEGNEHWILPDIAPHAAAWTLSQLIDEEVGVSVRRVRH